MLYYPTVPKEFDAKEYVDAALSEINREIFLSDPVLQRCRIVSFVSRSAGRGKKRRERWVELLVVDDTHAYCIENNEIKQRKNKDYVAIDSLAHEILSDLPEDERTVDRLLERAKRWQLT